MEINKENYEAFLLDLWEGNLSEGHKAILYSFLDKHPELDEGDALALLDDVSLTTPNVEFDQATLDFESINKKNYEFFFIAYLEGDLSTSEIKNVDEFLSHHPELNTKFEQFKKARLTEATYDTLGSVEKEGLDFEQINIHNYEFFFIAYAEGDLSDSQIEQVDRFISDHPELSKEFSQFSLAKLPIDETVYPHKDLLLKDSTPIISIQSRWLIGVAAASVALFFFFSTPFNSVHNKYSQEDEYGLDIDKHEADPFRVKKRELNTQEGVQEYKDNVNISYASSSETKSDQTENQSDSVKNSIDNKSNTQPTVYSRTDIKSNGLSNVVASLNKKKSNPISEDNSREEIVKQEKIPTILEYTTAYLQSKNVLNENGNPNLKGLLNTTLASNNDEQPALETKEESNTKRTIFKLGDFKFERIAKK
jgi:hypothetical protein